MIIVPDELAGFLAKHEGAAGRAFSTGLPELAAGYLDRWDLTVDGPSRHGMAALVLPVVRADGTPAALKLQLLTDESVGEATALRVWDGDGAVRLLEEDPGTGAMLLERLDAERPLSAVPDHMEATQILAELLARLVTLPAPEEIRTLNGIAEQMLEQVPQALTALPDPQDRRLVERCADAVRELLPDKNDRLLHWDMHFDNVLAGEREPWLAIDPKPISGDPGFDVLPALDNRWDDIVATGDVGRAVRRRFDLMVEVLGIDRQRVLGWTLGRILQNTLWDVEDGETKCDDVQAAIGAALLR